jgi:2-keto-3-deoxy-L-arabinonate dehydratase
VSDAINIPIMVQDAPLSGVSPARSTFLPSWRRSWTTSPISRSKCPFAADKLAALIEAAGEHIDGPFDGEEAATLLADLDAGCTGTMTSAMFPEMIRPIVVDYRAGNQPAALAQWQNACR